MTECLDLEHTECIEHNYDEAHGADRTSRRQCPLQPQQVGGGAFQKRPDRSTACTTPTKQANVTHAIWTHSIHVSVYFGHARARQDAASPSVVAGRD